MDKESTAICIRAVAGAVLTIILIWIVYGYVTIRHGTGSYLDAGSYIRLEHEVLVEADAGNTAVLQAFASVGGGLQAEATEPLPDPVENETLKAVITSRTRYGAPGYGGTVEKTGGLYAIPGTWGGIAISSIDRSGTAVIDCGGHHITLRPGEAWIDVTRQAVTVHVNGTPVAINVTITDRIRHPGVQEKPQGTSFSIPKEIPVYPVFY